MENSSQTGNKKHISFQSPIKKRYQAGEIEDFVLDVSLLILPSGITTVAGLRFHPHTTAFTST